MFDASLCAMNATHFNLYLCATRRMVFFSLFMLLLEIINIKVFYSKSGAALIVGHRIVLSDIVITRSNLLP